MALYIPHSIFHLARLLYVRPETFGPYYIAIIGNVISAYRNSDGKYEAHCPLCRRYRMEDKIKIEVNRQEKILLHIFLFVNLGWAFVMMVMNLILIDVRRTASLSKRLLVAQRLSSTGPC